MTEVTMPRRFGSLDETAFKDAVNCEIAGLGTAGREDDFSGIAIEQRGDLFARALHRRVRPNAVYVAAGRIAEMLAQIGQHGFYDIWQQRRRAVVVQVDRILPVGHDSLQRFIHGLAR